MPYYLPKDKVTDFENYINNFLKFYRSYLPQKDTEIVEGIIDSFCVLENIHWFKDASSENNYSNNLTNIDPQITVLLTLLGEIGKNKFAAASSSSDFKKIHEKNFGPLLEAINNLSLEEQIAYLKDFVAKNKKDNENFAIINHKKFFNFLLEEMAQSINIPLFSNKEIIEESTITVATGFRSPIRKIHRCLFKKMCENKLAQEITSSTYTIDPENLDLFSQIMSSKYRMKKTPKTTHSSTSWSPRFAFAEYNEEPPNPNEVEPRLGPN